MSEGRSGGVGIFTLVGIVFVILKLVGVIDWDWVWVLAPFWIGIALFLLIVGITMLVVLIAEWWNDRNRSSHGWKV